MPEKTLPHDRHHDTRKAVLRRNLRIWMLVIVSFASLIALMMWLIASPALLYLANLYYGPLEKSFTHRDLSVTVSDRKGRLLRAFTTGQDRWRLPIHPRQVGSQYLKMLIAYEDQNFFHHNGTDLKAFVRAAKQLVTNGHIVSGGSTLTMQVARLLEPRKKRSLSAKLRQAARALQLEAAYSKEEILRLYLTLAPFGGNLEGVRAASLAYFGKEPVHLSIAQSALLVALPQNPEMRRPDRFPHRARQARDFVLKRMMARGILSPRDALAAIKENVPTARLAFPRFAPHLTQRAKNRFPGKQEHRLTLSLPLQKRLEKLARHYLGRLAIHHSLAIIVADNSTGHVLGHIGSPSFLEARCRGYIDMTLASRSPGSALKPLIYGLGFEDGIIHPMTLIEDRQTRFGAYTPQNFDREFHGTVSIRTALQKSLNIPAVKVLEKVGPARFLARMKQIGIHPRLPKAAIPNLSLALGGLGMTLEDMTRLYLALANGGQQRPLQKYLTMPASKREQAHPRLLSPAASWYLSDILSGTTAPHNSRTGRIAFKTGTSYGYRDAWAAGYNGKYTVAVWVGRPDGAASPGLTGTKMAVPLLFDVFGKLDNHLPLPATPPQGVLVASHGKLPSPLRYFEGGIKISQQARLKHKKLRIASSPPRILFPPQGAKIALKTENGHGFEELALKAEGGRRPLTWLVNGRPIKHIRRNDPVFWQPGSEGFSRISILDAEGRSDTVTVRIE